MYMSAHRHHPQGLPAWCASAKLAKQNEKAKVFSRNITKNRQSLYENDNDDENLAAEQRVVVEWVVYKQISRLVGRFV